MKVINPVIILLVCVAAGWALPTNSQKKIREEVEIIPMEKQTPPFPFGDHAIIDTDNIPSYSPYAGRGNPFGGLFDNFEGVMNRMREQMQQLMKRLHFRTNSTEIGADFPTFGQGIPAFPPLADFDLGKGNTTSVTKVIDGHKVVINETEYKNENDFGGQFFKVRIIDVLPDSSELTTEAEAESVSSTSASPKDIEHVEDSLENEIEKSREMFRNRNELETFDELDTITEPAKLTNPERYEYQRWEEPLEYYDSNNAIGGQDLTHDIYVNQIMQDAGVPTNPDAEVFDVELLKPSASRKHFEKMIDPR